ncbi:MAG TPA: putative glycolipid-binding domain-containing protein [Flavipsychrobacter sp.]|nr:putative glycolipid-binding domain-containing protein [Flavipsychrobacter sp.]
MQTNIIWKGRYYQSMEYCNLVQAESGNEIQSTIIGYHEQQIFKVEYHIHTNKEWEVYLVSIHMQLDSKSETIALENKDGIWYLNSKPEPSFKSIVYIDISLTPFTNTLPVNGMAFENDKQQIIDVIYFDLLEKKTKPSKQIYTRLSTNKYLFQTYDGSFKAEIEVDEQGLVTDYPQLFEMLGKNSKVSR